ncbi:hypothetical protein IQ13_2202 [Lacibacter cauensis]|uniref:Uncharacterized protein n=1 Tax=Lacibacter cauensis TaxID=510947 RepID=A0A562SK21_9BACT|nr:hypothetical protein [Lacibacter cauensis]TWI81186.1 hypothetical protein IQ13_2202 [Lacibacter cauensis]
MNLLELLKRSGISKKDLFCDIVKQWGFTLSLYKIQFQKQIGRAPLKEHYITAKIQEFNLFFLEGKATGMFAKMGEVADLLRIGFHLQIGHPETRIYDLINNPEFKNARFNLAASIRNAKYLSDVSSSYQGLRMCELKDEDEKTFEALSYVVEGGNFAMLFEYLKKYGKEETVSFEATGGKTKLYWLLKKFYEGGCEALNPKQVQGIARKYEISQTTIRNYHSKLKNRGYLYDPEYELQVLEFKKVYELLLEEFRDSNLIAFKAVELEYTRLNNSFPDL